MRSGLGRRYYLRPTQGTLRLSRTAHGCFHPHDQRVEAQSTVDAISDVETLRGGVGSKCPEIHPSDQGVQYLSNIYISTLRRHNVEISLAQREGPWENGYAERLIRTLKEEEVHLNDYKDVIEARDRIGHFITQVYHQKRPHSALGYLTPVEFQRQNLS